MRSQRVVHSLALIAALALLLAACGGDDGESSAGGGSEATTSEASGADFDLISEGTLTVCSDSPYQPFEFEEDGEWKGFDVSLVNAIANDLGLVAEFRVTPFDAIQSGAALSAGQCDLAASAMTITEERAEKLAFTDPYFDADQSLLVSSDDASTYGSLDALAGAKLGVQASTTGQRYAEENAPDDTQIVEYPDSSALFQAIQGGEIAGILQDFPVNAYFATQNDTVEVVEQYATGEQYGFAASKDNTSLVEAFNTEIERLKSDGTYDNFYTEWFGEPPAAASEGASEMAEPSENGS